MFKPSAARYCRGMSPTGHKVGLQCDELLRIPTHRLRVESSPANFYPNILAVHPSELLKPLAEYRHVGLIMRVALRSRHQDAEARHPVALLRMRPERPCSCHPTEQRDEIAPPHCCPRSSGWGIVSRQTSGLEGVGCEDRQCPLCAKSG